MNFEDLFPFPQTLGKQRDINTVASDPNQGKIARPTQYEPQSLISQAANYVNNWLGNVSTASAVKKQQSIIEASKVGNTETGFKSLSDTFTQSAAKFSTIADSILAMRDRTDPAAKVPGRPVAPATTHYQYANRIDADAEKIIKTGKDFVEQVKGLFTTGYPQARPQEAVQASSVGSIGAAGGWPILAVLAVLWVVSQ